jgi:Protein of unknown function (DUF2512).
MVSFILKWLINGAIVTFLLVYYTEASYLGAFVAATFLTVISYFVGDQFILRMTNNAVATVADAVIAFVFLWFVAAMMNWSLSVGENLAMVIILGIAEAIVHRYILPTDFRVATNE